MFQENGDDPECLAASQDVNMGSVSSITLGTTTGELVETTRVDSEAADAGSGITETRGFSILSP